MENLAIKASLPVLSSKYSPIEYVNKCLPVMAKTLEQQDKHIM